MPIDFNPIGLNIELPTDIARLNPPYTNITGDGTPANPTRISIFDVTPGYLYGLVIAADGTFQPHTPVAPSGCRINSVNYFVRSHIGAGVYGSVASVDDGAGNEYVIKIQILNNDGDLFINAVKEAINNYIWYTASPDHVNRIYSIALHCEANGNLGTIVFLLEKQNMTFADLLLAQQGLGALPADFILNPTINIVGFTPEKIAVGQYMKSAICKVSKCVEHLAPYRGTHGDLHSQNVMISADGSALKIIDFGISRCHFILDESDILIQTSIFNDRYQPSRDITRFVHYSYCLPVLWGSTIDLIIQGILTFDEPIMHYLYGDYDPRWWRRDTVADAAGNNTIILNHMISGVLATPYDIELLLNKHTNTNGRYNIVKPLVCPPAAEPEAPAAEMNAGGRRRNRKRRYTRKYAKKRQIIRTGQRQGKGQGKGQKGRRTRRASSSLY